jgi:hypothetical protein
MIRNNILALALHLVMVLMLCVVVPSFVGDVFFPPDKGESGLALAVVALYLLALYPLVGYHLRPQSSVLRNLLSVSALGVLLIFTLLADPLVPPHWGFFFDSGGTVRAGGLLYRYLDAGFFYLFSASLYAPGVTAVSQNMLAALLSLLPTLLLWVGLQVRSWQEARHSRQ